TQTRRPDRRVPPTPGRARVARLDRSAQRQRLVANERQPPGDGGHEPGVVRLAGSCESGSAIRAVATLKETAGYASTSGGVGGRGPQGPLLPDFDNSRRPTAGAAETGAANYGCGAKTSFGPAGAAVGMAGSG